MRPNRSHMVGARFYGDAVYVGGFSGNASAAITWPAGTRAGDTAILVKKGSAPPGATWASPGSTSSYGLNIYVRELSTTDVQSPPTPGSHFVGGVYREPEAVAQKATLSHQGSPGSGSNEMSFTKSLVCAGRVVVAGNPAGYNIPGVGSPFTGRSSINDGSHQWRLLDHLNSAAFTSGAGVNTTWDTSDPSGAVWAMLELTN